MTSQSFRDQTKYPGKWRVVSLAWGGKAPFVGRLPKQLIHRRSGSQNNTSKPIDMTFKLIDGQTPVKSRNSLRVAGLGPHWAMRNKLKSLTFQLLF